MQSSANAMAVEAQPIEATSAPVQETTVNLLGSQDVAQSIEQPQQWNSVELHKNINPTYLEDKTISGFKTVDDLAKAYQNANKLIGKRIADLSQDELVALNIKAGVPQDKRDYDFNGLDLPEQDAEKYRNVMHELGLSKDTARKFLEWQQKETADRVKIEQQELIIENQKHIESLKKEFGDTFDARINLANKALAYFGGEELAKVLNDYGLGANPTIIKALVKASEFITEGKAPQNASQHVGMTPQEIDDKINQLRSDRDWHRKVTYGNVHEKEQALKQMQDLVKLRFGG